MGLENIEAVWINNITNPVSEYTGPTIPIAISRLKERFPELVMGEVQNGYQIYSKLVRTGVIKKGATIYIPKLAVDNDGQEVDLSLDFLRCVDEKNVCDCQPSSQKVQPVERIFQFHQAWFYQS